MTAKKNKAEEKALTPTESVAKRLAELQGRSLPAFQQNAQQLKNQLDAVQAQLDMAIKNVDGCGVRIDEMRRFAVDTLSIDPELLDALVKAEIQAMGGPVPGMPVEEAEEASEEDQSADEESKK